MIVLRTSVQYNSRNRIPGIAMSVRALLAQANVSYAFNTSAILTPCLAFSLSLLQILYFECRIDSRGEKGYIGLGFCDRNYRLDKLPGWEKNSFGFHGDDGHKFRGPSKSAFGVELVRIETNALLLFLCCRSGTPYSSNWKAGDVIGCGMDLNKEEIFFTK